MTLLTARTVSSKQRTQDEIMLPKLCVFMQSILTIQLQFMVADFSAHRESWLLHSQCLFCCEYHSININIASVLGLR